MEKPIEMAKLLMKENHAALDTINLETCYKNPNPITLPIPTITPLVVWYSLIDFDTQGSVKFYKDVYHRLTY
jgi:murein L,D-transpeptidase YcbB/YkuD